MFYETCHHLSFLQRAACHRIPQWIISVKWTHYTSERYQEVCTLSTIILKTKDRDNDIRKYAYFLSPAHSVPSSFIHKEFLISLVDNVVAYNYVTCTPNHHHEIQIVSILLLSMLFFAISFLIHKKPDCMLVRAFKFPQMNLCFLMICESFFIRCLGWNADKWNISALKLV